MAAVEYIIHYSLGIVYPTASSLAGLLFILLSNFHVLLITH